MGQRSSGNQVLLLQFLNDRQSGLSHRTNPKPCQDAAVMATLLARVLESNRRRARLALPVAWVLRDADLPHLAVDACALPSRDGLRPNL